MQYPLYSIVKLGDTVQGDNLIPANSQWYESLEPCALPLESSWGFRELPFATKSQMGSNGPHYSHTPIYLIAHYSLYDMNVE